LGVDLLLLVPKLQLGNKRKDHFEILARSLERQRVSAVAGGKLELPGQGVPKLELGSEGKGGRIHWHLPQDQVGGTWEFGKRTGKG
jgi:hypothetical protein